MHNTFMCTPCRIGDSHDSWSTPELASTWYKLGLSPYLGHEISTSHPTLAAHWTWRNKLALYVHIVSVYSRSCTSQLDTWCLIGVQESTYSYVCMYIHICVYKSGYLSVSVCMCVYMYVRFVCMSVCMYIRQGWNRIRLSGSTRSHFIWVKQVWPGL